MRRLAGKLAFAASLAALAFGVPAGLTSAAFTAGTAANGSSITVDALRNIFAVAPGTAVQPGTATPVAGGNVDSLALALGTVPSARTFTNVFTVTNHTSTSQTATLSLLGVSQVAQAFFASSGTTSATLGAGASTSVTIATSPTSGGHGNGSLRLGLAGTSWLYRDYPLTLDEDPEAPASLSATAGPGGAIALSWPASTTTQVAGYDLYRSAGASFTKLNAAPLASTGYTDSSTTNGTSYTYKVIALTSSPGLQSLDSPTTSATADASAPTAPTTVSMTNGGGTGSGHINAANASGISVQVALPAGSNSSDTVAVTLTDGILSVTKSAAATAGAGTVTITGINTSSLADGTLTIRATSVDLAGNVSAAATTTAPKDTLAPAAPACTYSDQRNAADKITGANGAAEAGAIVSALETTPASSGPYTSTAGALGAYSLTVARVDGKVPVPVTVTYTVTATDAAGNTSPATTISFSDTI